MACRKGAMPHSTGFARGQGGMLRYSANHPAPAVALRMRPGHGPWCERSFVSGERGGNQRGPRAPVCFRGRAVRSGMACRKGAMPHSTGFARGQGGMLRYSANHPGPAIALRMRPGHGPWCERSFATGKRARPGSVGDYRSAPPIAGRFRDWLHRELSTAEPGWARRPPQPEWTYRSSAPVGPVV